MKDLVQFILNTDQLKIKMADKDVIHLAHGSGGKEMDTLIQSFNIGFRGQWNHCDNDAATYSLSSDKELVFTTDSFVVSPIFFPGANIGHLASCGTINDLVVMGAQPLGLSLSFVIEEGFPIDDLNKIILSIKKISDKTQIPIVTGDTKVMPHGKIDKIIINTSGVGIVSKKALLTKELEIGDKIILSGGLGEHAVALLSKRFGFETEIKSDSKPLNEEMNSIKSYIKMAKDPTRGGIAAILNDIAGKNKIGLRIYEEKIPVKEEVLRAVELLGINLFELASEGRLLCIASADNAEKVEDLLKKFNSDATIIGEVIEKKQVEVQTFLGKRLLPSPTGRIVPRIC